MATSCSTRVNHPRSPTQRSPTQSQQRSPTFKWDDRFSKRWTVVLRNQQRNPNSENRRNPAAATTSERNRGSFMFRLIQNHYTLEEPEKSPQQISRESWLFPAVSVPFNRWFCMPAAFLIQFCCGCLFTWIVFDKPIDKFIYGSAAGIATPYTFYIAVGLIGVSAMIMGPWLERKGPKMASFLGATLFYFGNIIVAIALHMKQRWLVYVGYGVSAGYGIGLCFISPISALQKWFPDHRGLASGIAVTGFGAGSLENAKLEMLLINAVDLPLTFVILGVAYFLCIFAAGLILRTPPPGYSPNGHTPPQFYLRRLSTIAEDMEVHMGTPPEHVLEQKKEWTLLEALSSTEFRLMYVMFLANLLFNLNMGSTAILPEMVTNIFERSENDASLMIYIKGCFDILGRILFPLLSDYLGRKNTYFVMLSIQLVILAAFYFITVTRSYWLFAAAIWTVAACYGGGFGTLSVLLVEKFGAVNCGPCFGVIITAWSLAGIAGGISLEVIEYHVPVRSLADPIIYNVAVWLFLGIVTIGWIALLFVQSTEKDKEVYKIINECIVVKKTKALFCTFN